MAPSERSSNDAYSSAIYEETLEQMMYRRATERRYYESTPNPANAHEHVTKNEVTAGDVTGLPDRREAMCNASGRPTRVSAQQWKVGHP
jgi:hypothetical protein